MKMSLTRPALSPDNVVPIDLAAGGSAPEAVRLVASGRVAGTERIEGLQYALRERLAAGGQAAEPGAPVSGPAIAASRFEQAEGSERSCGVADCRVVAIQPLGEVAKRQMRPAEGREQQRHLGRAKGPRLGAVGNCLRVRPPDLPVHNEQSLSGVTEAFIDSALAHNETLCGQAGQGQIRSNPDVTKTRYCVLEALPRLQKPSVHAGFTSHFSPIGVDRRARQLGGGAG